MERGGSGKKRERNESEREKDAGRVGEEELESHAEKWVMDMRDTPIKGRTR